MARVTGDKRYRAYRIGMWAISLLWAAIVVGQSVSYYVPIGEGKNAMAHGHFEQSEQQFKTALQEVENSLSYRCIGDRDMRYANALNNLAELYRVEGRYKDSENLYCKVCEIARRNFGGKEAYALSLNNLAALYRDEGRYHQAEDSYKEALFVWGKLKKTGDVRYSATLNGLGKVYRDCGRFKDAEELYKQALTIRQKILGDNSPEVAEVLGNLGTLYREEGRYDEAKQLYDRALAIDTANLGQNHPFVATDLHNEGALLRDEGHYAEAQPYFLKGLRIREMMLGGGHPHVAKSLLGMAENSLRWGKYKEAKEYLKQAYGIDEKAFGKDNVDYAAVCDMQAEVGIALFSHGQEDSAELERAEQAIAEALRVRAAVLSREHPDYADSLRKHADILVLKGDKAAAKAEYEQALAIQTAALGREHPDTKRTSAAIAELKL